MVSFFIAIFVIEKETNNKLKLKRIMYNELVLVINYDKVNEEDRNHARLLLSQLKTASGRHLMRKEITYFLEDMVEKYGDILRLRLSIRL